MDRLSCSLEQKLAAGWRVRQANFPAEIIWDYPVDTVPVSVTGAQCALHCAHCNAAYLAHMVRLEEALEKAPKAPSFLISGGSTREGRVPVAQHVEAIARLAPGRRLNFHVGLLDEDEMDIIAPYVDTVSFDFVGDDATIREVYGLDQGIEDYVRVYRALAARFRVVPHLTIGLRGGQLGHELPALRRLQQLGGFDTLVYLVLIPTEGTAYAGRQPPSPQAAADLITEGRLMFPEVTLSLGCMRPHGEYRAELDCLAVRAGANRIVSPSRRAMRLADDLGLRGIKRTECCVL